MMERTELKVPVRARDNHGNTYDVTVFRGGFKPGQSLNPATGKLERQVETEWVLRINETPGHWYMQTLLTPNRRGLNEIALDWGQNWMCTNFAQVLEAAMVTICTEKVG